MRSALLLITLGLGALLAALRLGGSPPSAASAPSPAQPVGVPGEAASTDPGIEHDLASLALEEAAARHEASATPAGDAADRDPRPVEPGPLEPAEQESEVSLAEFQLLAASTLADVQNRKAQDRRAWLDGQRRLMETTLGRLQERLGLDAAQTQLLGRELLTELDRGEEYVRLRESGTSEQDLADLARKDRREQAERLETFLTQSQLRSFLTLPRNDHILALPGS